MKIKMISFIAIVAFITTAFDCNPDSIGSPYVPHNLPLFQELQGQYQSNSRYTRLILNNDRYCLYLGDTEREEGMYRINEFGTIELGLTDGLMTFEIHRGSNGQIIRLVEALSGESVLNRVTGQEENNEGDESISYHDLDMGEIRQNLAGRYRGTINDQYILLDLDNVHNTYRMDRGDERYFGHYDIEFTRFGVVLLLYLENESEAYNLHIVENRVEEITFIRFGIQGGILNRDVIPLQVPEFYSYTYGEVDLVRQNLIGRYQGTLNNEVGVLDIRAHSMGITINGVTTTSDYVISFLSESHPLLAFERDGIVFNNQILFAPNSHTQVIGLCSTTPNFQTSYFYKVENNANEVNIHDEP